MYRFNFFNILFWNIQLCSFNNRYSLCSVEARVSSLSLSSNIPKRSADNTLKKLYIKFVVGIVPSLQVLACNYSFLSSNTLCEEVLDVALYLYITWSL